MLLTSCWSLEILLFFITITLLLYKYYTRNFNYWKKKGVYYLKPIPFFGNAYDLCTFKTSMSVWFGTIYKSIKEPLVGIFVLDKPHLIINSPEIIKQILVQDFNYFTDRIILAPQHDKMFTSMIFIQKGPDWRKVRSRMSPVFSSGKLRNMFDIINRAALDMNKYLKKNRKQLEAKEVCAKYSTDVITICAFAIKAHSFDDENAAFRNVGRALFDFRWRNAVVQFLYFFGHGLANCLHLNFHDTWLTTFLTSTFWETIRMREKTGVKGHDVIDVIMTMRKNKELCKEINFVGDTVVAQAAQFFSAGFETTSSVMAFTLYELCIHPEIQKRLREEIQNSIKDNNGLTYEGISDMKYLDMCFMESLRMFPPLPFLDRRCVADYRIPGTDVIIDKGTPIFIPLMGLHYDEKFFPNPTEYNPERWSDRSSYNSNGLYYIPFGEGPRICIGERFGTLAAKLGLAHILSQFTVEKTSYTPLTMEFEPKTFLLQSKTGLHMLFKEITPTSI